MSALLSMFTTSLKARILVVTCCMLVLVLALTAYAALAFGYMAEDRLLVARLAIAQQFHQETLHEHPDSQATGDQLIVVFWSAATKPSTIPADFLALPLGIHEWSDEDADGFSECVIRVVDGADGRRFIYVYDSSQLESELAEEQRLGLMLVSGLLVALLVCLLFVAFTSRWVFAPLQRLRLLAEERARKPLQRVTADAPSKHAQAINPIDSEETALADHFRSDEIGRLAHAFDQAQARLQRFLTREQHFTRDASHELRTPVTVIEGALDLLAEDAGLSTRSQRALQRLRRACQTMRMQIDAFLTLAREPGSEERNDIRVMEAVNEAIARHKSLDDRVRFQFDTLVDRHVRAPRAIVFLVIENLFTNAIRHGLEDEPIRLTLVRDLLRIQNKVELSTMPEDPMVDYNSQAGGTGLGLSIVQGLCERCGWTLACRVDGEHFIAEVSFGYQDESVHQPQKETGSAQ